MSAGPGIVATPPPYKDPRGWLIAFGTFEILIGCVLLGMIALTVFAMRMASSASTALPAGFPGGPSPTVIMAMVAVFYGLLAVLFVAVGIGSIQARRWARIAMLVIGWCWLAMGVMSMAMMALLLPMIMETARQQAKGPIPPGFDTGFRVGLLVVLGAFAVVLPLIFILFYSGKNVKATCEHGSADRQETVATSIPDKPLKPAVVIAALWFALATVSYLGMLFFLPALPLFGFVLAGWGGRLAMFVMSAVSAWLTWNLYQQRSLAWRVAVGWIVFGWVSLLVTQSRLGIIEMYHSMGYNEVQIGQMMPFLTYGLVVGWVFGMAFFVFLIAIRKQFDQPVAPTTLR